MGRGSRQYAVESTIKIVRMRWTRNLQMRGGQQHLILGNTSEKGVIVLDRRELGRTRAKEKERARLLKKGPLKCRELHADINQRQSRAKVDGTEQTVSSS